MKYDEIINKINSGEILSEYGHDNRITRLNNRDFMRFDCSGFVAWYIGQNGYLRALAQVRNYLRGTEFLKINRFYCQDFEQIYKNSHLFKHWRIHKNIFEIAPNDILIIVYDDGNGHMMIVDKVVATTSDGVDLRIVDSTRLLHGNDTRTTGQTGIGCGDISLAQTADGVLYDPHNPTRTPTAVGAYIATPIK